jgi:hypothetical protein
MHASALWLVSAADGDQSRLRNREDLHRYGYQVTWTEPNEKCCFIRIDFPIADLAYAGERLRRLSYDLACPHRKARIKEATQDG